MWHGHIPPLHQPRAGAATPFLRKGVGKAAYFVGVNCSVNTSNGCSMIVVG